ncbi:MAG: TatD family hydrolase [Candidatus Bathyarchaeota archaeon]|nr:TatD family hydrolase [Candidatus Bathyarchaeota archaeon]
MLKLVDSHVHLDELENFEEALKDCRNVGVLAVVGVGSNYASNSYLINLPAECYGVKIYIALGIHPWAVTLEKEKPDLTLKLVEENSDKIVGVGEVGLDFWLKEARKRQDVKDLQIEVFKLFLDAAREHGKPVIIHSRGAWEECLYLAEKTGVEKAVFHWFTGPLNTSKRIVDDGYFISATPAVHSSKEHQLVIKNTPLENILIETDSPVKYGGISAKPSDVTKSLEGVAKIKGLSVEEVAKVVAENFEKVFNVKL